MKRMPPWLSLSRWLERLTPHHLDVQLREAKQSADEAARRLQYVAEREPHINHLVIAHAHDRACNHYGERVARALRGEA